MSSPDSFPELPHPGYGMICTKCGHTEEDYVPPVPLEGERKLGNPCPKCSYTAFVVPHKRYTKEQVHQAILADRQTRAQST